ncbi:MAG: hypothetical protein ACRCTZ_21105 [Sarcina sp.]
MIQDDLQLQMFLLNDLQRAVDNTLERCLNELQEIIMSTVYGAGTPIVYERTNEFLESFKENKATIKGLMVQGEIFQDFMSMSYNPESFTHGSYSGDVREYLADIINDGAIGLFGDGWYSQSRPFWDEFIYWVDNNLNSIFEQECKKLGLPIKSISISF